MKKNTLFFFVVFCLFMNCSVQAQSKEMDTTQIINNIKKIGVLFDRKVDSCKSLIVENIKYSEKIKFDKGTAKLYLLLTQFYILKGLPDSATAVIPNLEKAAKNCSDKVLSVNIILKIALIYSDLGNFSNAIKKAIEAQQIAEGEKNDKLLSKVNHDLGLIYSNKQLYKKSLSYYKKGLEYAFLANDSFSIANLNARIGGVYTDYQYPDSGLIYNTVALKYFQGIKMQRGVGVSYNNIAESYEGLKKYEKAVEYYLKALPIRKKLGDEYAITILNYNLGVAYMHMRLFDVAEKYLLNALKRNKSEKDFPQILQSLKQLCNLYSERNSLGAYRKFADEYITLKDSITSSENIKAIGELQEKYQSEKKEKNILMLKKENEKQDELAKSEQANKFTILLSSSLIILLLSIFGFVLFNRYKLLRQQKEIIEKQKQVTEHQKNLLETKQKEIVDSIKYAKRLQEAILPSSNMVKQQLPNSFIFYKPKDIVAGDFYWMETMDDKIFIAAADCTGHGVPGAMVSVVCSNAMNRVVKEFGIIDTGKILDKVSQLVVETFEKSGSDVNDGMDISICSFNKSTNELKWSGANNPLWLIRNSELIEFKPNKQPIGKVDKQSLFVSHNIQLQKNDVLYLFTDGFSDQFGGEKGKKFKYAQLKKLFLTNNDKTMEEQKNIIETTFNNWKGNLEQVDDVLLIGIKI